LPSESSPGAGSPVAVTFARPEESGAFRRRIEGLRRADWGGVPAFTGRIAGAEILVVHVGIGLESAARTIRAVLGAGRPRLVIGAGFGGGLDPRLRAGDTVTDDFSRQPDDGKRAILSRAEPVETAADKRKFHRETGAQVVDMETAALVAACNSAGVPLIAIRAVSDTADEALPVPFAGWFDIARQRVRPMALVGFLMRNPSRIAPFARFVRRLPRVATELAQAIERTLRASAGR
jgi:adenosylhomocysteine nucleosidase